MPSTFVTTFVQLLTFGENSKSMHTSLGFTEWISVVNLNLRVNNKHFSVHRLWSYGYYLAGICVLNALQSHESIHFNC